MTQKTNDVVDIKRDVIIAGDRNRIHIRQNATFDQMELDTFWKRLRWLLTGRVKILIRKEKDYENSDIQ